MQIALEAEIRGVTDLMTSLLLFLFGRINGMYTGGFKWVFQHSASLRDLGLSLKITQLQFSLLIVRAGTILEALRRTVDEVGVVAVLKRLSVLVALMDFMNIKGQIKVRRRPLEAAVEIVVWYEVAYSSGDEGRPQVQTSSGGRLEA